VNCRRGVAVLAAAITGCAAPPPAAGSPAATACELQLRAPLPVPRPSFFHAALLVPPMQSAALLPAGEVVGALSSNHSDSKSTRTFDGVTSWFAGCYHEWIAGEVHWGALAAVELWARTAVGGWDEVLDHFNLYDQNGNFIVRDEERLAQGMASQRHENVTRLDLGSKWRLLGGDDAATAIAVAGKIPIARPGDLSNAGTFDLAATLLETVNIGEFTLHANAGWVWPLGQQTLFHADQDIELNPFAQAAVGATVLVGQQLALDLQVQANTSAFRDVPFLSQGPIGVVGGLRQFFGRNFAELSCGRGFEGTATDRWEAFFAFGRVF
jgi:hypothetical protein